MKKKVNDPPNKSFFIHILKEQKKIIPFWPQDDEIENNF